MLAVLLGAIIGKTKGAMTTAMRILHKVTSNLTAVAIITRSDWHFQKPVLLGRLCHSKVYGMFSVTVLKKDLALWRNQESGKKPSQAENSWQWDLKKN